MITLFIFTSSCEEEVIDIQEYNVIQKNVSSKLTDRQKINRLKSNLKYRVKAYNFKHGKNHFIKKYGGLDLDNHISFRFKEMDDNFVVVIPFKKKKSKKKVLIAYYKNGKEHYKVVNKRNYSKKKKYAVSEKAFIDNLNVIFDMVYQNSIAKNKNIMNKYGNCTGIWMFDIPPCISIYINSCTNAEFEIDTCGKGGDGYVDYDSNGDPIDPNNPFGDGGEVLDGEATSYQDIDLGPDNSEPDVDPIDTTDPTYPEGTIGECDGLEFDCGTGGGSNDPVDEDDCDTSKEDLKKVFPNTSDEKLTEIANAINKYAKDFGIDTKYKLQHFIAQAGHESASFTRFKEITGYKIKVLHLKWPQHFNPYTNPDKNPDKLNPNDYANNGGVFVDDEKFYNYIYNDENRAKGWKMGNTEVGDGYKFIGRGIWMLTGRENYEKFNTFYQNNYDSNVDVVSNPSLLSQNSKIAIISALWFFQKKLGIDIDSNTTVEEVTKSVNGGTNGLADRKNKFKKSETNIDCN